MHERLYPGSLDFGFLFYMIFAYWGLAILYDVLDNLNIPFIRRYQLVRRDEPRGNQVTKQHVIIRVLMQHTIQTALGFILLVADPDMCVNLSLKRMTFLHRATRFVLGMFIMDTWQFVIHRYLHVNTYLYKHLHSTHHNLVIPYAYGALYNSILEGFILDTIGGVVTLFAGGLDCETAVCLFTFATCKTVLDHSNYRFPLNPIHNLFPNCSAYHDVHHDFRYIKRNFSQPFFTHWDWMLGSFTDPAAFHHTVAEMDEKVKARRKSTESKKGK